MIRADAARTLLGLRRLVGDAEEILHMVAHFVRDDVGAREIPGRAEFRGQLPVEGQVDVNLLIARTVEWSGGRAGETARGGHLPAEQHQLGRDVGLAHVSEIGAPDVLGLARVWRGRNRLGDRWPPLRPPALGAGAVAVCGSRRSTDSAASTD